MYSISGIFFLNPSEYINWLEKKIELKPMFGLVTGHKPWLQHSIPGDF